MGGARRRGQRLGPLQERQQDRHLQRPAARRLRRVQLAALDRPDRPALPVGLHRPRAPVRHRAVRCGAPDGLLRRVSVRTRRSAVVVECGHVAGAGDRGEDLCPREGDPGRRLPLRLRVHRVLVHRRPGLHRLRQGGRGQRLRRAMGRGGRQHLGQGRPQRRRPDPGVLLRRRAAATPRTTNSCGVGVRSPTCAASATPGTPRPATPCTAGR